MQISQQQHKGYGVILWSKNIPTVYRQTASRGFRIIAGIEEVRRPILGWLLISLSSVLSWFFYYHDHSLADLIYSADGILEQAQVQPNHARTFL